MKSKLLIIALIAAGSFTSCKKDRTCTCSITYSNYDPSTSTFNSGTASDVRTVKKVTKRQALAGDCASGKSEYKTNTYTSTTETECKLN